MDLATLTRMAEQTEAENLLRAGFTPLYARRTWIWKR